MARFFEPWIGGSYADGVRSGRKLLVVGDSHYADEDENKTDMG